MANFLLDIDDGYGWMVTVHEVSVERHDKEMCVGRVNLREVTLR